MNRLMQDVSYALRQFAQVRREFTVTAVITLALGIGANAAIFTLVQGILLTSLPVADPAQLYRVGDTDDCCVNGGFVGDNGDFDIYSYDALSASQAVRAGVSNSWRRCRPGESRSVFRRGNAVAKSLTSEYVTGNYFTTLGVGPYLGRLLVCAGDDTPSSPATAVLSYQAWQGELPETHPSSARLFRSSPIRSLLSHRAHAGSLAIG